jgi:DNA-binding PadR family transcriptional regulator
MATPNRTSYAMLGLLAQGPKSGYEIKQIVAKTISHFWKESYGHIYPTLNHLMSAGLVVRAATEREHTSERARYVITTTGREELASWLALPVEPEGTRNELALKLYFGHLAPISISRAHLEAHRDYHSNLLGRYLLEQPELEARAATGNTAAVYDLITLSLGTHISEARIAWCDDALKQLAVLEHASSEERPA